MQKKTGDEEQLLYYYLHTQDQLKPAIMASAKAGYLASKAMVNKKRASP
ncbi:MAG: hypothetical protein AB7D06_08720 [Pedobacter sp.]